MSPSVHEMEGIYTTGREKASCMRSLCTLYVLACQMRVTVGDSGFSCLCVCVTSFERLLNPLFDSYTLIQYYRAVYGSGYRFSVNRTLVRGSAYLQKPIATCQ